MKFPDIDINIPDGEVPRIIALLRQRNPALAHLSNEEIMQKAPREQVMASIAFLQGMPYISKIAHLVSDELLAQFDPGILRRGGMVPLTMNSKRLTIAVANPYESFAVDYCSQQFRLELVVLMGGGADIARIIESRGASGPSEEDLATIEMVNEGDDSLSFSISDPSEDVMTELVRSIFVQAVAVNASDIHIKTEENAFYSMFRVDGDLCMRKDYDPGLKARMDAFLLNMVKISRDDASRYPAVSSRLTLKRSNGRKIDVRYERHRAHSGYHITLRLLDKTLLDPKLGQGSLSFDAETLLELRKVMAMPDGILIMSGPTGSGKSTTLGAMLREIYQPKYNIMTLENPVEDVIPGVIHCDMKSNEEFPLYFRSMMRSDPDVLLVGEIRDKSSAELAVEAAITGHQVLTTTHANSAADIFNRLALIGVERWKIAATVRACCAQRLLKRLCPHCRQRHEITAQEVALYNLPDSMLGKEVYSAKPGGCMECNGRGYSGRMAVLEILPINEETSDFLISPSHSTYQIQKKIRSQYPQLRSLRESALQAIISGQTDLVSVADQINLAY
jgi:type IV pilus assembly protein PilB